MKKVIVGLLIVITIIAIYFGTFGLRDDLAWSSAIKDHTAVAVASYIHQWPQGHHIQDARVVYDDCRWAEVKRSATRTPYDRYLQDLPNGRHIADARQLVEMFDWQEEKRMNRVDTYQRYLAAYPQGSHTQEARQAIETLHWQETAKTDQIAVYQQYLKEHPQSPYVGDARTRIAALQHDDTPYQTAIKSGSEQALHNFLTNFPGHVREADVRAALRNCEGRDIVDLINAGVIETRIDGSSIHDVSLEVRRRVPYPVTVHLPVGTFFNANSSDVQNMITTEAASVTLEDSSWTTVSVNTACANRPRHIPGSDNSFSVSRAPNRHELSLLMPVLEKHNVEYTVRQAAVWIVTDDASFDDLQILVNGFTQSPVIDADAAVEAMRICEEAGIDIRHKAIWSDREILRERVEDGDQKRWLRDGR